MNRKLTSGDTLTWEQTLTPGAHRAIGRPTRVVRRTETVTYLGPIQFEPVLVRVRRADGSLAHVDPADLR